MLGCRKRYRRVAWFTLVVAAALPLAGCASAVDGQERKQGKIMTTGVNKMLDDIYASAKPVRFEQLDVSDRIAGHFPPGTRRAAVRDAFKASTSSKIVEDSAETLVVRDNKGQAMLDPDAQSIVMTFSFDVGDALVAVKAVHLKNQ